MAQITLKFNIDGDITSASIRNAVRRSLTKAEVSGEQGEAEGITYVIKQDAPKGEAATMREWARKQGIQVGARGRIHPDLKAAYAAAH